MSRGLASGAGVVIVSAGVALGYWQWDVNRTAPPADVPPAPQPAAAADPPEPVAATPERIELNLKVGDRFPMIKTVAQTLTQMTTQGPVTSHATLQLMLAIEVEEIADDGRKRFAVDYSRVRYTRDVGGTIVEFDSQSPPAEPPAEARLYQGLVGNGFSFWIGADNRIVELVGFRDFLQRCVADVPAHEREAVLRTLGETTGEDGLANFVDDSIGLLPDPSALVQVGHVWQRDRQIARPLPIRLTTECRLASLDERLAEIDIAGTIAPLPAAASPVHIRGGRTMGHCTIDRATGLPLESRIEHAIDMLVQPAAGEPFAQRKHILTTVQAFPQQQVAGEADPHALGN